MNGRNARGAAAARRARKRLDRDRNERSTGDSHLSDDIAQEHEPQLNQLQDEPVRSSHYDDRYLQTESEDVGQE
ncbi:MAG TPA: hypothetical protein VME44_00180 [Streptosporangiaceae bacterium]|nr:hypothetical protein [Streptosporangiaceae bacterium]